MHTVIEQAEDVTVVAVVARRLDAGNAEDFRRDLAPVLQDCRKLVLDLSAVEFVDSRGCGSILSCLKRVSQNGGDLKLCHVAKNVRTVFDLIRLHRICEILGTKDEAVRAFKR